MRMLTLYCRTYCVFISGQAGCCQSGKICSEVIRCTRKGYIPCPNEDFCCRTCHVILHERRVAHLFAASGSVCYREGGQARCGDPNPPPPSPTPRTTNPQPPPRSATTRTPKGEEEDTFTEPRPARTSVTSTTSPRPTTTRSQSLPLVTGPFNSALGVGFSVQSFTMLMLLAILFFVV